MQHGNAALTFGPPFYTGYGPWAQIPGRLVTLARLLISSSLIVQVQVFHLYEEKSVAMRSLPRHAESTRRNVITTAGGRHLAAGGPSSYVAGHLPPGGANASRARSHLPCLPHAGRCRLCLPPRCPIFSPGPPVSIFRRRRPRSRSSAGCDVRGGRARCDDRYLPYPIPHRVRCFCVNITSSSAGQSPGREIAVLVAARREAWGWG